MLEIEQDEDWVNLSLAYLRICALLESPKAENQTSELKTILEEISRSNIEVSANNHPAFAVRILDSAASHSFQAGLSEIRVAVTNNLPMPVGVSSIYVDLESSNGEQISYSSTSLVMSSGENIVTLSCPISVQGLFFFRGSRIYLNAIEFYHPPDSHDTTIKVTRRDSGPIVRLGMPNEISLDKDQKVVIDVVCGSWAMRDVRLMLESPTHETSFIVADASCVQRSITAAEDGVRLGDLGEGSSITVMIPISTDGHHELTTVTTRVLVGIGIADTT